MLSESRPNQEKTGRLVMELEQNRIEADVGSFGELYSDYQSDMRTVENLRLRYYSPNEDHFGKLAEAYVFFALSRHPINEYVTFRPTNPYDDYMHGADFLAEPKNALVQAVASMDITINQENIKFLQRKEGPIGGSRPRNLEAKLVKTQRYTDHLASLDSSWARDLSAWLEAGGLHQRRGSENESLFKQAEDLFLMKYYKTPDFASEPGKAGFVIGGPQAVISLDSLFINKALNGGREARDLVSDLAVLEFAYCVQAEQEYLDKKVMIDKARNIFFDTHYSKVKAWSNILNQPELRKMLESLATKNAATREFREQIIYYRETFEKVYGV